MSILPAMWKRDRVVDAVLVVLCGVGQAAAAAFAAFATRDAFAALHTGGAVERLTLLELGGAGCLAAGLYLLAQRRSEALGQSYANSLRRCLYRQIASLPKSRHEQRRLGALSLRFVGDLSAARLWFGSGLPDVLTALVVLPGAAAILIALEPGLAPAGMIPLALALAVAIGVAWHLEERHRVLRTRRAGIAISMIERIAMSPELDLMGRTDRELKTLAQRGALLRQDAIARRSRTATLQAILQAGTAVAGLSLLWQAGQMGAAPGTVAASLAVLALLILPLQNAATAWDRFCGWQVARGKALNLFREATVERPVAPEAKPVEVTLEGDVDGTPVSETFPRGEISYFGGAARTPTLRRIAGLDQPEGLTVAFDGTHAQPKVAYIGDDHIGLQGSLRRTATLLCRGRPSDEEIAAVLRAYGLGHLLERKKGLGTRIAEAGRNLTAEETVRLDLVRAELGQAGLVLIDSVRLNAMPNGHDLLEFLKYRTGATVIVAYSAPNKEERHVA